MTTLTPAPRTTRFATSADLDARDRRAAEIARLCELAHRLDEMLAVVALQEFVGRIATLCPKTSARTETSGSYRTRPGDGGTPIEIRWESYPTGRGWRVDLWVNGQPYDQHVDPDEIAASLCHRVGPVVAKRVERRFHGER